MSEFKSSGFRDEFGNAGPDLVGITTLTSPYYFVPPSGTTAERPQNPAPGMLRFNTDIGRLEIWKNDHWETILGETPSMSNQQVTNSAGGFGTRAVYMGGGNPGQVNDIDYITIETLGNAQDFGNLTGNERGASNGQAGSRVKGLAMGGSVSGYNVESIKFASTGSAVNHGNLFGTNRRLGGGVSNQTRALFAGGMNPTNFNIIDMVDIASTGNAKDFGDLSVTTYFVSGLSSCVRGIFSMGRETPSPHFFGELEYVTLSTQGNSQDFGDLSLARAPDGAANAVRGIFLGGQTPSITATNIIDFIIIASTGNAQDFGDLTTGKTMGASVTSPTRCVHIAGKNNSSSFIDEMDYVQIATAGNAIAFGELAGTDRFRGTGASSGHGGL